MYEYDPKYRSRRAIHKSAKAMYLDWTSQRYPELYGPRYIRGNKYNYTPDRNPRNSNFFKSKWNWQNPFYFKGIQYKRLLPSFAQPKRVLRIVRSNKIIFTRKPRLIDKIPFFNP